MKFKTLVAIAVSSLLATSFVYAADEDSMMNLADNSGSTQQGPAASDNIGGGQNNGDAMNLGGDASSGMAANNNSTNNLGTDPMLADNSGAPTTAANNNPGNANNIGTATPDDMSADTATGDDDY